MLLLLLTTALRVGGLSRLPSVTADEPWCITNRLEQNGMHQSSDLVSRGEGWSVIPGYPAVGSVH